jgi:dihydroorotase
MPVERVIRAATNAPAAALQRPDLGTFRLGAAGDASILRLEEGGFAFIDSVGEKLTGHLRLAPIGVVHGGKHESCTA